MARGLPAGPRGHERCPWPRTLSVATSALFVATGCGDADCGISKVRGCELTYFGGQGTAGKASWPRALSVATNAVRGHERTVRGHERCSWPRVARVRIAVFWWHATRKKRYKTYMYAQAWSAYLQTHLEGYVFCRRRLFGIVTKLEVHYSFCGRGAISRSLSVDVYV